MDIHGEVTLSSAQMVVKEMEVETKEGEEKEKEKEKKEEGTEAKTKVSRASTIFELLKSKFRIIIAVIPASFGRKTELLCIYITSCPLFI